MILLMIMREESDSPDGSSGAEVKGDDDYTIGE
jgi:hypothetical protein